MRIEDLIRWSWKGVKERKLRTSLTILGIVVGAAAIVALVSQTAGLQASISAQLAKLGPTTIFVLPSSNTKLTLADVANMKRTPGVADVIPAFTAGVEVYGTGWSSRLNVLGVDPNQMESILGEIKVESGRLMSAASSPEAVLGYSLYHPTAQERPLANVGEAISVEFKVEGKTVRKVFYVVGTLEEYGTSPFLRVDRLVFISLESAKRTFNRDYFDVIFIKAGLPEDVDRVVDYLRVLYGTNVEIITVKQVTNIASGITSTIGFFFGTIAAISLFVAGLGIMNIMFVSVMERTREIGVLKAIGFKDRDVMMLFLWEAMLVGIIGGVVGILAGMGSSFILPSLVSRPIPGIGGAFQIQYAPVFSPDLIAYVLIFSVVVSVLAGFLPARRAAKLNPVVALRHE